MKFGVKQAYFLSQTLVTIYINEVIENWKVNLNKHFKINDTTVDNKLTIRCSLPTQRTSCKWPSI